MKEFSSINWHGVQRSLDDRGFATVESLLAPEECESISALYEQTSLFRSTVNMQRYRFGAGEYKYFEYPLPDIIRELREFFYPALVPVANGWMEHLGLDLKYPGDLQTFLSLCGENGQKKPTPLVLRYETGCYNTLHQDIYGEIFFPFQVVVMLTQHKRDYDGGELVFVEQLPRAQSRLEVLNPSLGDAVVFTTNFRPVKGLKGYYRARMKHGVSPVKRGLRFTTGIIFHDAK
ncbi:MAG: 2OG-Fe(II) oxygenase [Bacteroidota bacterium]|nr:2OG-Fe(II) oxygenase [Bacteroidota bacterium]